MSVVELSAVLGNMGEFVGAIAVVLTLFYLAIQVKHSKEATEANTRALDEDRKIALAQAYSARSAETSTSMRKLYDQSVIPILIKRRESGIASLSEEERWCLGSFLSEGYNRLDANHLALEQGLLPEYGPVLERGIRLWGPLWREMEIENFNGPRESFKQEVDRVLEMVDEEAVAETP